MKFIHLSNVCLGTESGTVGRVSVDRKKEFEEDFEQMLRNVSGEHADCVFITGNLFAHVPSEEELNRVDEAFSVLEGTRIFLLTGRMDAPEDPSLAKHEWKNNVTVFSGDSIQRIYISRLDLEVTGVGYSEKTWNKVKLENMKRGRKATLQILLLPFVGNEDTNLVPELLPELPFDYIGLGQTVFIRGNENWPVNAPGRFEPVDYTTQLKHGYFIGTLEVDEKGRSIPDVQFVKAAKREYIVLQVNADRNVSFDEIRETVRKTVQEYGTDNCYRVILTGTESVTLHYLKEHLYDLGCVAEIDDRTAAYENTENGEAEGEAVRRFLSEMQSVEDDEVRRKATAYGLSALMKQQKEGD